MYSEYLQQLIQINFLPIGIILFLVVFLVFNFNYEKKLTLQFVPALILLACLVVDDNIEYYLVTDSSASIVHVAVSVIGYDIRILLMMSLIFIAARGTDKRQRLLLWIPAVVNICVTSLAFFTRLVFWYGDGGQIFRGPLAYAPHFISLVYAMIFYWYAYRAYKLGRVHETIIISIAVTLSILGTLVETLFALRGILIGVVAMDTTFYYLYIHNEFFKTDTLTGALNRLSFYADIERIEQRKNKIHILSVDLNGLKHINDTYGHTKGDEAIKYVADLIKECLPPRARLYRIGGDEFVVLYREYGIARSIISDLKEKSADGEYTYAVGEYLWDGSISFEKAYMEADKQMYEYKKKMKGQA